MEPIGNLALYRAAGLPEADSFLRHVAYTANATKRIKEYAEAGVTRTETIFPTAYRQSLEPGILGHVVFALKHEIPHLGLLYVLFKSLDPSVVADFVRASPTGAYARRVGFLYELLTARDLSPLLSGVTIGGNYVDVLDSEKVITSAGVRVQKWRVNNNLLGSKGFIPMIERTKAVSALNDTDWKAQIEKVISAGNPSKDLLSRALNYLYHKETRSTYMIERQTPSAARATRFVGVLSAAGKGSNATVLTESFLVQLQNQIVEARWAERHFRTDQNFIGSRMRGTEIVHYIPPPPESVRALMESLAESVDHVQEGILKAIVGSFGFVFIHPFDDGNGRLHRFLLHDILVREAILPSGVALPLASVMQSDMEAYDQALEAYSRSVLRLLDYRFADTNKIIVLQAQERLWLWQYPDLTPQVEYISRSIPRAIDVVADEISYLSRYETLVGRVRDIIDMPDEIRDRLLNCLQENGGKLSNNRRKQSFPELTAEEIEAIEKAYADVFLKYHQPADSDSASTEAGETFSGA